MQVEAKVADMALPLVGDQGVHGAGTVCPRARVDARENGALLAVDEEARFS